MKPAILVIDMLNDFVNGKLACLQAKAIVRPIQRMLLIARKKHIPIIYTNDAHSKNKDKELKLWGEHAIKGTEGAQIIPELKPTKSDIIIEKHHFSGFFQTKLQQILSKLKIDTLIIVGLQTHICVLHTIADAYQWDYKIVVPKETTASFNKKDYVNTLNYMKRTYGAKITTIGKIIKELS